METSIVGVGVGITDRFRSVVEEKAARIEHLAPRAQRVDIKVTHRAYHNGRIEDDTVELTLTGKGPLVRAEATDGDKFAALDLAVDKLCEQLRRAKDKRVDARNHPRGAKFEKGSGAIQGIDLQPASIDVLRAVATGEIPVITGNEEEADYTPVVIRTKEFDAEWMTVEEAVDRMELVGHDFFLFIDARSDHPSVVYRRKGWDYGVISLTTLAPPARARLVERTKDGRVPPAPSGSGPLLSQRRRGRAARSQSKMSSRRLPMTRPPRMPPMTLPPPPRGRRPSPGRRQPPLPGRPALRAGGVDVALSELERLAREEGDAARHRHAPARGWSSSMRGRGGRGVPRKRSRSTRMRSASASARARVGADPAAVAGDDVARDGELAVGVVDRVADVLERRDGARRALLRGGDRGIQPGVRLAQPRELRERVGVDARGGERRAAPPRARPSRR